VLRPETPPTPPAVALRVGLIGHGAIGRRVADELRRGAVAGAQLTGVLTRTASRAPEAVPDIAALIAASDLVVEAAGHGALQMWGAPVLDAGIDLLVVSTGALADPDTSARLRAAGTGRLLICPGAIGGLDLLRSVRRSGPGVTVRLTSTKRPAALLQPWMPAEQIRGLRRLRPGDPPEVLHDGSAVDAASRFPQNANVAATLALAADDWDAVTVRLVADAGVPATVHLIEIDGPSGSYRLEFRNHPSPDNPSSSGLVAFSVIRSISDLTPSGSPAFL
jgi:aspartate dehydrogenase